MIVFSISDIPEFSNRERIVVVGIIGKSPYRYPNKSTPLLPSTQSDENGIECHWDEHRGILYLHALTFLDTKRLEELAANLDENSKSTEKDADAAHWLVASGELAADSCRVIALIFQLCHIVVLSHPTSSFDLGYLQLFKAIDAYRTELTTRITAALSDINATGTWETHGRCCCPRLLFHFRRPPTPLQKNPAALKRLEHATEDQLYFILRKTRIITNVCAKSLFAIPKNEEFVYISSDEMSNARDVSALVRDLVQLCNEQTLEPDPPLERPTFRTFLQGHIEKAMEEGFDDNVGKYAMSTSFFELPSAQSWRSAASALAPVFLQESPRPDEDDESEPAGVLYDALATDVRFSAARCAKVLPIAQASYTEGLPSHYSRQHHAHKTSVALNVLSTMARGPLGAGAAARLQASCAALWRSRTLCEELSLTGHGCVHPDHDNTKEHSSGVRYVSACACGRTRAPRDDPYTIRAANYDFYVSAAQLCDGCDSLDSFHWPVFEPSTPSFTAATVKPAIEEACSGPRQESSPASASWSAPDDLSPPDHAHYDVTIVSSAGDRVISRQPSTTEYLPGMLHTSSPPGLLPRFSSWSLLCLGASSLYSHALGLADHLQPGFLPHTNYLLPWDCAPRSEQMCLFRTALSRGRGKSAPHITVKIFIGFEYECPRGHRFMMSSPENVMTATTASTIGAGAKLAATSMPVIAGCPCRAGQVARLAKLHVVTPKAPVYVTVDPKVQPVANGPIFVPHPLGSPPIKLSASAYWILRFPYIYCDERGPLPRGHLGATAHTGKVIAPMFGLLD